VLLSGDALAADADDIPEAKAGASLTVFLDISVLSRKRRAADKINELHAQHAERGWVFADLEIYTENGDLQGYFITYVGRVD
jgi:hypothetical protein